MAKKMEEKKERELNSVESIDKKKELEISEVSLDLDDDYKMVEISKEEIKSKALKQTKKETLDTKSSNLISCLKNEKIIVRHIPKETGLVTNPKHILYGGMAENATRTYVVPKLSSGTYVNVLTDNEKAFLEDVMGLEYNALSIYKKVDNFWDDGNEYGISRVRLHKQDNYLDLSSPEDYIKYKILLANKDFIAPSLQALSDYPKETYQFVIINEGEEVKKYKDNMDTTMRCYKEYGKIENDVYSLRVIIESLDGRPTSSNSQLEFLQTKINSLIQANSKLFLKVITDPLLPSKVLIKKCIEAGLISYKGNYLYLTSDGRPLCENNADPTLNNAAQYISSPKRQDLKFTLEAKLKQ